MSEPSFERWEARLRDTAGQFPYPPTPDIASGVQRRLAAEPAGWTPQRRQLAWAAAAVALILAGLLAVPQVRAGVLEVLRIGAIRILLTEPTLTATVPVPTAGAAPMLPTATPRPTPTPLASWLDLAGATTLEDARSRAGFPIRLPTYPPDLGSPDRVFLQDMGGPAVILVWLEADQPEQVRLSLHQLGPGTFAQKVQPRIIRETTVQGQPALWTEGPYLLQVPQGGYDIRRLIEGNVLIWTDGEVTYRLETALPLEEAVRIAESLQNLSKPAAGTSTLLPTVVPTPTPDFESSTDLSETRPGTAWHFESVGHHALGSMGWHAGLALKDHCAYIGNRRIPAINILDIADPAQPAPIGAILLSANARAMELRTLPDLNLLVVADLGADGNLLTFDVTDCAKPQPLGSLALVRTPHEFFLWRDGARVLAYVATFSAGPPDLLVIDLTGPAQPTEIARWSAADDGAPGQLHSLSLSPDGTTAYLAMWNGGLLVADVNLPRIAVKRDSEGDFTPANFPGAHSAVRLRDPRFVLLTSEIYLCPFGGLAIADIADPAHPKIVSRVTLPENRCDRLPQPYAIFTAHNPLVVGDLVFLTWYAGGVQALDVSDPYVPKRVGQFVPAGAGAAPISYAGRYPVQTWSYPILRDGLLYVADIQSGLYVLRYTGPGAETLASVPRAEGNVIVLP